MRTGFLTAAAAVVGVSLSFGIAPARAGDDGAAPLWEGVGSIFSPLLGATDVTGFFGFGAEKETPPPIDYHERGKLVVPKSYDLPAPGGGAVASQGGDWPVDQETQRKKLRKEAAAKKNIAGQGDARLRYTHPFPNAPVTTRAADQIDEPEKCANGKCDAPQTTLGVLNPLGWVGIGKSTPLGPEPDREWLTDPPKGYRAPSGQATN
jgi:hypothetical protein